MELTEYLGLFLDESKEHIQSLNEQLLLLEQSPDDKRTVNEAFRSAHTLKGMAATMGFADLAELTHGMENVLDSLRNQQADAKHSLIDIIFQAVDLLDEIIQDISNGGTGEKDVGVLVSRLKSTSLKEKGQQFLRDKPVYDPKELLKSMDPFEVSVLQEAGERNFFAYQIEVKIVKECQLKSVRAYMVAGALQEAGEIVKSLPSVEELKQGESNTSFYAIVISKETEDMIAKRIDSVSEVERVRVEELDVTVLFKESQNQGKSEHLQIEAFEGREVSGLKETRKRISSDGDKQEKEIKKTIRVHADRLDSLMNLFEEFVIERGRLELISSSLKHSELQETVERMTGISRELQSVILNMRMVEIEQVFNRFPRMVRQLAKDLKKQVELKVTGAETELDRAMVDEIGDPLVHLIRNAIDHGIENPETRKEKGKKEQGTLHLHAYHRGSHVFIEVSDDGAGINHKKIAEKAVETGLITNEQAKALSEKQTFQLIMESGFSTAEVISDVSGRGVGMDVVKSTIESIGGSVSIDSQLGIGSLFSIQLPLTLSILPVMLIGIENETYAVPLSSIIETAQIKKSMIKTVQQNKVIDFRGSIIPLIDLKQIFSTPKPWEEKETVSILMIGNGNKMTALAVDRLIGRQEVVLKPLGEYLDYIFAISGATILGDGHVALIIDSQALIECRGGPGGDKRK